MSELDVAQLDRALRKLLRSIDISPSKYQQAVERYQAVGAWLEAEDSDVARYQPAIYPQGSFQLGTVVRPIRGGRESDYDIDLVCALRIDRSSSEPALLKNLVGDRLKDHATYRRLLGREGRRCWTLNYAEEDGVGFHLDALPAVEQIVKSDVPREFAGTTIAITEKDRSTGAYSWVPGGSNPRGYAAWFASINQAAFARSIAVEKAAIAASASDLFARVEDVPDGLVRTPLQRAVQLLKRHRDVRFANHKWESERPISMIITTLAARGYRGEADTWATIQGIVEQIATFADSGLIEKHGALWYVGNPVNPAENFADRWNDVGSARAEAFFSWLGWLQEDLALLEATEPDRLAAALSESFASQPGPSRPSGALVSRRSEASVLALADSSHCAAPLWPVKSRYKVSISGTVRRRGKTLWTLSDRSVPKGYDLRFEATTDTPPPFEVKWQVVNTGAEAVAAGREQLRGGFDDGEEGNHGRFRKEETRYLGTHWIEAFVVKNEECVARSGRFIVRVRPR